MSIRPSSINGIPGPTQQALAESWLPDLDLPDLPDAFPLGPMPDANEPMAPGLVRPAWEASSITAQILEAIKPPRHPHLHPFHLQAILARHMSSRKLPAHAPQAFQKDMDEILRLFELYHYFSSALRQA